MRVCCTGLSHDSNVQKMRTLTFIQLAEGKTEVSFDTIQREMQIGADEVESCVIDGGYLLAIVARRMKS